MHRYFWGAKNSHPALIHCGVFECYADLGAAPIQTFRDRLPAEAGVTDAGY